MRVRRIEPSQAVMCGVEFIDPHPDFIPVVYRWIGRQTAVENADMR